MVTARLERDGDEIELLSILPDDLLIAILSFLPTPVAARTSVLCRRFRYLWEASPSLVFTIPCRNRNVMNFIRMGDRAIHQRHPSHPILSLHLDLCRFTPPLPDHCIYFLLKKAHSLGLRHLTVTVEGPHDLDLQQLIKPIFSIDSLRSLSLPTIRPIHVHAPIFKSCYAYTLNCPKLTNLSLRLLRVPSFNLTDLLPELPSLQNFHLEIHAIDSLSLSSQTITNLNLILTPADPKFRTLQLFLPSLESLHFETRGSLSVSAHCPTPIIHGQLPVLKTATIILDQVHAPDVTTISSLFNTISYHVQELILHVKEEKYPIPIPILLEPGKDMPTFPNLKHLDVSLCFHELNFEAVTTMVRHCPALESLKLVHKIPKFTDWAQGRKRKDWRSDDLLATVSPLFLAAFFTSPNRSSLLHCLRTSLSAFSRNMLPEKLRKTGKLVSPLTKTSA
ncbi:hypothetical protein LUZ63_014897 [Rhynchospora breviuscula]|uniref:F-box domain-containing protein n=1 Tax=Rhynchospora breviuscula TaxID=2022672 RepID=A0A9Q0CBI0_9POAL|nr:hypothetical protein LUZ63_014897 [Rhynchospora breviuscula]